MKRLACLLCLCAIVVLGAAQGHEGSLSPQVVRATQYGIGTIQALDTYLSPAEYHGMQVRVLRESSRHVTILGQPVIRQTLFQAHGAFMNNHAENSNELTGIGNWNLSFLKPLAKSHRFAVAAGPLLDLDLGMTYNMRNSNNPIQVHAWGHLAAAGMATYKFSLKSRQGAVRYMLHVPMVGLMFSPEYDESYYEMSLARKWVRHFRPTTLASRPSMRQFLSVDVPVCRGTIRLTYETDIQQAHVQHIKSHQWSHVFMLGFIKSFRLEPYKP